MTGTDLRHRLAAILAADAAGYSRLMAADERGTLAVLDAGRAIFRKHIELNQGRVVDTAGDSVLAVFDTATGATLAALAIQVELASGAQDIPMDRRLLFRIGLHLGDVIEKSDGTIYGDGVNIAARLQALADAGGTVLSDSVRNAVYRKVGAGFDDLGVQSVKNIAEPVRAYRVRAAAGSESTRATSSKFIPSSVEIDLSLPDKPSIAVLPFTNMSSDPEQEYFADGVTEDIITELSRFHSLFVIARNSTFTYKGKPVDIKQVSRELGVRYVLEGSVRRASNRIRVTAQLIDSVTANHIWAEKYDRMLDDIFEVQEEITKSIVSTIAPEIEAAERLRARRPRPSDLTAYEIAVRAWADARVAFERTDKALRSQAIQQAKEAISIDPRSTLALNALAFAHWQDYWLRTSADLGSSWKQSMDAAQRAIELDRSDSTPYSSRAILMCFPLEPPPPWEGNAADNEVLADVRRAHDLNPNDAWTLNTLGFCEALWGKPVQAIEHLSQCLRNNPRDPVRYNVLSVLSMAHFLAKDYERGITVGLHAIGQAPNLLNAHSFLAMNYVGQQDLQKAKTAFEIARKLAPEYIEARLNGLTYYRNPEQRLRATLFLRIAAGINDPSAADSIR